MNFLSLQSSHKQSVAIYPTPSLQGVDCHESRCDSRNDRFATPSLRGSVSVANTTKQSKRKDK